MEIFQSHVVEKIFQSIVKFNILNSEFYYFDSYVYYLTRGFIASIRAFNFLTRVYNLTTRGFLISQIVFLNLVTRVFGLLTRGFELVTRNSCFSFPSIFDIINYLFLFNRHFLNFRVSIIAKKKRLHQIKNSSRIHNL